MLFNRIKSCLIFLILISHFISLNSQSQEFLDPHFGDDGILEIYPAFKVRGQVPQVSIHFDSVYLYCLTSNLTSIHISRFFQDGVKDISFGNNGEIVITEEDKIALNKCRLGIIDKTLYIIFNSQDGIVVSAYDFAGNLKNSFGDQGKLQFGNRLWFVRSLIQEKETLFILHENESRNPENPSLLDTFKIQIKRLQIEPEKTSLENIYTYDLLADTLNLQAGFNIRKGKDFLQVQFDYTTSNDYLANLYTTRISFSGEIDDSYGNNGVVHISNDSFDLRSNESIVNDLEWYKVFKRDKRVLIMKINEEGGLDSNFFNDGIKEYSYPNKHNSWNRLESKSNAGIFCFETICEDPFDYWCNYSKMYLSKFNFDFSRDDHFGEGGQILLDRWKTFNGIAINEEGNVYVYANEDGIIFLAKLRKNGTVHTSETSLPELKIFPNPTNSMVQVESENIIERITLHNLTGQKIFDNQFNVKTVSIDISNYNTGIFLMTICSNDGCVSRKIVVAF